MHGEKRRFMRFNVLLDALCRTGGANKKLKVNNFSKEGIGILSKDPFNQGDDVEVELMIPGDNIPVVLQGEVAWSSDPISEYAQHRCGLKFNKVKNEDKGRILEYIYHKWMMPSGTDPK
ncbi:PilZ domain-containing protein [Candidatus Omnitrophota bacterium]